MNFFEAFNSGDPFKRKGKKKYFLPIEKIDFLDGDLPADLQLINSKDVLFSTEDIQANDYETKKI
jgi:hypothetical protein